MSRSDARQVKPKSHRLNVNLFTVYNPIIKTYKRSYGDPEMKNIFPEGIINATYKKVERNYFSINVSSSLGWVSFYGK